MSQKLFDELRQRARDLGIELSNAQPPTPTSPTSPAICRRRKTTSSPPAHAEPAVTAFGTADKRARAEAARHERERLRETHSFRQSIAASGRPPAPAPGRAFLPSRATHTPSMLADIESPHNILPNRAAALG
ncbi:hypothetical protein Q7P35_008678 [Cladosporium inversicolor]